MFAEQAYLFRHAVLRDAAYQLQLPGDRAQLHALALDILESEFGGPPPGPRQDAWGESRCAPHPIDAIAAELALHAGHARAKAKSGHAKLLTRERLYARRAAEHAERTFQTESAISLWQAVAALVEAEEKADALRRAGALAYLAGQWAPAESLCATAKEHAARSGAPLIEGLALGTLGLVYMDSGRQALGEQMQEQSLAIHRQAGHRRAEGLALANLALLYQETGRIEQAERCYDLALPIFREVKDRRSEGILLGNLPIIHRYRGRSEQAERTYEQALAILREAGDRRTEGNVLANLAIAYHESGRTERAERTYEQALAINRETGNRRSEGVALGNLAVVFQETGRLNEAQGRFEHALGIHREVGNRRFEGAHLCSYGLCLMQKGMYPQGRGFWLDGVGILRQLNDQAELKIKRKDMREVCGKSGVPPFEDVSDLA